MLPNFVENNKAANFGADVTATVYWPEGLLTDQQISLVISASFTRIAAGV